MSEPEFTFPPHDDSIESYRPLLTPLDMGKRALPQLAPAHPYAPQPLIRSATAMTKSIPAAWDRELCTERSDDEQYEVNLNFFEEFGAIGAVALESYQHATLIDPGLKQVKITVCDAADESIGLATRHERFGDNYVVYEVRLPLVGAMRTKFQSLPERHPAHITEIAALCDRTADELTEDQRLQFLVAHELGHVGIMRSYSSAIEYRQRAAAEEAEQVRVVTQRSYESLDELRDAVDLAYRRSPIEAEADQFAVKIIGSIET